MATVKTPPAAAPSFMRSKLFLVLIFGICLLLALAVCIVQYMMYEREKAVLREDIIYARNEMFIDLVKQRLDVEMPEGKWATNKYCSYHYVKLNKYGPTCYYEVKNTSSFNHDMFNTILSSFSSGGVLKESSVNPDGESYYFGGEVVRFCSLHNSKDTADGSVSCRYGSLYDRYPVIIE